MDISDERTNGQTYGQRENSVYPHIVCDGYKYDIDYKPAAGKI